MVTIVWPTHWWGNNYGWEQPQRVRGCIAMLGWRVAVGRLWSCGRGLIFANHQA